MPDSVSKNFAALDTCLADDRDMATAFVARAALSAATEPVPAQRETRANGGFKAERHEQKTEAVTGAARHVASA